MHTSFLPSSLASLLGCQVHYLLSCLVACPYACLPIYLLTYLLTYLPMHIYLPNRFNSKPRDPEASLHALQGHAAASGQSGTASDEGLGVLQVVY